jgi:hypothetical protein
MTTRERLERKAGLRESWAESRKQSAVKRWASEVQAKHGEKVV